MPPTHHINESVGGGVTTNPLTALYKLGFFDGYSHPGSFFLILGLWCQIAFFARYFSYETKKSLLACTPTQLCRIPCGATNAPVEVEGLFKVIFCAVGLIVKLADWLTCGGFCPATWEQCMPYTLFAIAGAFDLMAYYKTELPDAVQYVVMLLAFQVEAVLCKSILAGRSLLYIRVHTLLLVTILFCVAALLAEMRFRQHPVLMLLRAWSFMLHGSWFWQTGLILYRPEPNMLYIWTEKSEQFLELVNQKFALHCVVLTSVTLLLAAIVACVQMTICFIQRTYFRNGRNELVDG